MTIDVNQAVIYYFYITYNFHGYQMPVAYFFAPFAWPPFPSFALIFFNAKGGKGKPAERKGIVITTGYSAGDIGPPIEYSFISL